MSEKKRTKVQLESGQAAGETRAATETRTATDRRLAARRAAQPRGKDDPPPAKAGRRKASRRAGTRRTQLRRGADRAQLALSVLPQPDDTTCGPTCLHAVYRYYGDEIELSQVIAEVQPLVGGGTLAVWLANHALKRGYRATIHTYNLQIFDPTWFTPYVSLIDRLKQQLQRKEDPKLKLATEAYVEFLELGGKIFLGERTSRLIRRYLQHGMPILTGLSATYLYSCAREKDDVYDDVEGVPLGHFVVLSGYDQSTREVMIADPLRDNPRFQQQYYSVNVERLMASILLGIVTYDANLLILEPKDEVMRRRAGSLPPAPLAPSSDSEGDKP